MNTGQTLQMHSTSSESTERLGEAIVRLQATPIHVGPLSLYGTLERIAKDDERVWASMILREQV